MCQNDHLLKSVRALVDTLLRPRVAINLEFDLIYTFPPNATNLAKRVVVFLRIVVVRLNSRRWAVHQQ